MVVPVDDGVRVFTRLGRNGGCFEHGGPSIVIGRSPIESEGREPGFGGVRKRESEGVWRVRRDRDRGSRVGYRRSVHDDYFGGADLWASRVRNQGSRVGYRGLRGAALAIARFNGFWYMDRRLLVRRARFNPYKGYRMRNSSPIGKRVGPLEKRSQHFGGVGSSAFSWSLLGLLIGGVGLRGFVWRIDQAEDLCLVVGVCIVAGWGGCRVVGCLLRGGG
ncbi:hypothetical protein U1Q18_004460 [Sarracenia purpurea var. burkii]